MTHTHIYSIYIYIIYILYVFHNEMITELLGTPLLSKPPININKHQQTCNKHAKDTLSDTLKAFLNGNVLNSQRSTDSLIHCLTHRITSRRFTPQTSGYRAMLRGSIGSTSDPRPLRTLRGGGGRTRPSPGRTHVVSQHREV